MSGGDPSLKTVGRPGDVMARGATGWGPRRIVDLLRTTITPTTDNAVVRFDGASGALQNSTVVITDAGAIFTSAQIIAGAASSDVVTNANTVTPGIQSNGTTATLSCISASRWANSSSSPSYILAKSRGTSVGSHAVVATSDILGRISFVGDDGAAFRDGAAIRATVEDGTPSATAMGAKLEFLTAPNGSVTPVVALTIDNAGTVIIASGKDIQLGNSYVGTPQVPTGYIIIKDSTGTAYKVPCNV